MENIIKEKASLLQEQIVQWRREFHQIPELKMDTVITSENIIRILEEMGIEEIRTKIGGNGIACFIEGGHPGPCLGIRVDIDGLPIKEETGLPFASTNGNMHACGHDAHIAMGLGAVKLINEHKANLQGSVKFIFQPFEEGDGGAKAMIADGVLQNPKVDAMIALHTGNVMGSEFGSGNIAYHPEGASFAIRTFNVRFIGKSTHAATPQEGHDPIITACYAVSQIQALLSREKDPYRPAIAAITVIKGGERNNIVPDECYIEGTIRSLSKEEQDNYYNRIKEICEHTAKSMNCRIEMNMIFDLMPTVNDEVMLNKFLTTAEKIVDKDKLKEIRNLSPIGEDFARFADLVPSMYFFHCTAFGDERDYPHHNPRFDIKEENLWLGTALFTQFALDWQKGEE